MAGEVENIAISTQVEVVVDLKLELSLAIMLKVCVIDWLGRSGVSTCKQNCGDHQIVHRPPQNASAW